MPTRILIPDTFILVEKVGGRGAVDLDPVVTLVGSKSTNGTRILFSRPILQSLGFESAADQKRSFQIFVSSNTIKIQECKIGLAGSRRLGKSGYLSARELGQMLHLPEQFRFRCKAEVVKNGKVEVWATFPPELRDHIDRLNGVMK